VGKSVSVRRYRGVQVRHQDRFPPQLFFDLRSLLVDRALHCQLARQNVKFIALKRKIHSNL
jgi:hypothetical protein